MLAASARAVLRRRPGEALWRSFSAGAAAVQGKGVFFEQYGLCEEALREGEEPEGEVGATDVRVRFLGAGVSVEDARMIRGESTFSVSSFPAAGGVTGVAQVTAVGSGDVDSLAVDDLVLPTSAHAGSWRQDGVLAASELARLPQGTAPEVAGAAAAHLSAVCSAVAIAEEHGVGSNSVVAVSGADGAATTVAFAALAKSRGAKVVSVNRSGENAVAGADVSVDARMAWPELSKTLQKKGVQNINLGVDAVGGSTARLMTRMLAQNGTLVCTGSATLESVQLPVRAFIFDNATVSGFNFSTWAAGQDRDSVERVVAQAMDLIQSGTVSLKPKSIAAKDIASVLGSMSADSAPVLVKL